MKQNGNVVRKVPKHLSASDLVRTYDPNFVNKRRRLVCEVFTDPHRQPERITLRQTYGGLYSFLWNSDTRLLLRQFPHGPQLWPTISKYVTPGALLVTRIRIKDGRPILTVKKVE